MNFETQECYIISTCNHTFHRHCVEEALSSSAQCPICKIALPTIQNEIATQTEALRKPKTFMRGKGRGAMSYRPQTRSLSKGLYTENMNSSLDTSARHIQSDFADVVERTPPRILHPNTTTSQNIHPPK